MRVLGCEIERARQHSQQFAQRLQVAPLLCGGQHRLDAVVARDHGGIRAAHRPEHLRSRPTLRVQPRVPPRDPRGEFRRFLAARERTEGVGEVGPRILHRSEELLH
ncbi:MAG: hypothetical protein ACK559_19120, partial [bacterium]